MKNLKDYIGKPFNIICDNKEEWDEIVQQAIKLNYLLDGEANTYIKNNYKANRYLSTAWRENLTTGTLPNSSDSVRTNIKASEFISPYFEEGTYIVALKNGVAGITNFNKGCIGVIDGKGGFIFNEKEPFSLSRYQEKEGRVKSFKTKEEAEAFAETLKPKSMTLLEEAYKRYPIGTKIKTITTNEITTIKGLPNYYNPKDIYAASEFPNGSFLYKDGKWAEIVETPKVDKSKAVVHCKTQEEWDFVTKILNRTWSSSSKWSMYEEDTAINLNDTAFSGIKLYWSKQPYYIYSFEEWCKEFGHSIKVEYVEIIKQSGSPELYPEVEEIGKIFKVCEEKENMYKVVLPTSKLSILKERVKPSTKEAYDRQNSKTMHESLELKSEFKRGDKVLIVQDFSDNRTSVIQNTIGKFIKYNIDDNRQEYPYVVECVVKGEIEEYCVHKIEHCKEKKSLDLSKPFCILLTLENQVRVQNILGSSYFSNPLYFEFTDITSYYGLSTSGTIEGKSTLTVVDLSCFNNNIVTIEELEEAYSKIIRKYPLIPDEVFAERTAQLKTIAKSSEFRLTKPTKTFKDTTIIFPTQINIKLKTKTNYEN